MVYADKTRFVKTEIMFIVY